MSPSRVKNRLLDAPNMIPMTTLGYLDNGCTFSEKVKWSPRLWLHFHFTFQMKARYKLTAGSLKAH